MKSHNRILRKNEKGATAVFAAVILAALLGFAAIGVDVNYLYGVRNELHNAADAGSLAGASMLFDSHGKLTTDTRDAAIAEGNRVASANKTGNQAVVVGTVETGHWSFLETDKDKKFTANSATTQLEGWQQKSFSELDGNTAFINAVRVQTERSDTPSFFAKILGFDRFFVRADAVAYIGFPADFIVNQPIAICKESIIDAEGNYSCNMGRMINSGGDPASSNTGSWTNLTQPCATATPPTVNPLICAGNTIELQAGEGIGTTGGQTSASKDLIDCWDTTTAKKRNWNMTLPVIECPKNNVSNCATLVGAVNVNLIWIIEKNDPTYDGVPTEMTIYNIDNVAVDSWSNTDPDGFTRWKSFVDHFHLANVDGPPSADNDFQDYKDMYLNKSIFFLPDCEFHEPTGGGGGANFGIMAKIPKLVE